MDVGLSLALLFISSTYRAAFNLFASAIFFLRSAALYQENFSVTIGLQISLNVRDRYVSFLKATNGRVTFEA